MSVLNIRKIIEELPKIDEFENPVKKATNAKFREMGLPKLEWSDHEILPYPEDVVSLDDETLGRYYTSYMELVGYIEFLMSMKEGDILLVKSAISRYIKNSISANKMKKADAERHETVIALESTLTDLEIQYKIIEARHKFYDACSKALSRDLTRRVSKATNRDAY